MSVPAGPVEPGSDPGGTQHPGGPGRRGGPGRGRLGRWLSARWLAVGGGLVLAVVVGTAIVLQTTGGAACAAPPIGDTVHRGRATYYNTSGGGNCSYPGPPADNLFVALSPSEYAAAAGCGGYLDVTGPKGKVRVKIVDKCPGCPVGQIDLSKKAFARIADLSAGMVSITYRAAVNPALPRPLSFSFKGGTSQWWFAVLIDDHGNPLRSVEVRSAGKRWQRVSRMDYNYWVVDDGLGPGPFDIRVTDVYGQQATATRVRLVPDRAQRSGVYLYGHTVPRTSPPAASPSAGPSATGTPSASPHTPNATPSDVPSLFPPSTVASRTDC